MRKQGLLYDIAAAAIRFATSRIRRGIDEGKADYLKGLALTAGPKSGEILRMAKKAGIGSKVAKNFLRPLPLLLDSTGQPAENKADRDRIWLDHFGRQEFGRTMSTADFIGLDSGLPCVDEDLEWKVQDLPTFFEVEAAFRGAPRAKAVGLDGLPGKLLAAAPTAMAKVAHPLFLKAAALTTAHPVERRVAPGNVEAFWKPVLPRLLQVDLHIVAAWEKLPPDAPRTSLPVCLPNIARFAFWGQDKVTGDIPSALHTKSPATLSRSRPFIGCIVSGHPGCLLQGDQGTFSGQYRI